MIDRRLKVLRAIARHGTVTAAAEVCRSDSVGGLAPDAGARPGARRRPARARRAQRAADRGSEHAARARGRRWPRSWERAQADLAAHREQELTGLLRLCGFSTAAAVVAPRALQRGCARNTRSCRCSCARARPARAFDLLAAGTPTSRSSSPPRASRRATDAAFEQCRCTASRWTCSSVRNHPLAGRATSVSLPEVAADPGSSGHPAPPTTSWSPWPAPARASHPAVAHYADEWDTGAALVAGGFGVALVPRLADLPGHHATRRIPISGTRPIRHILAAVRAGSSYQPAIAAGLDALREIAARKREDAAR